MSAVMDILFEIGQQVYLKTDVDQRKRLVTGIWIRQDGMQYELACGDSTSWHYDFEIDITKDVLVTSDN